MTKCENSVLDFIEQTTGKKAKIEEIMENLNNDIEMAKIYEPIEDFLEEIIKIIKSKGRNSKEEYKVRRSVKTFVESWR